MEYREYHEFRLGARGRAGTVALAAGVIVVGGILVVVGATLLVGLLAAGAALGTGGVLYRRLTGRRPAHHPVLGARAGLDPTREVWAPGEGPAR